MKKSYLMIAAVALFAACANNEIKNEVQDFSESAIGFTSYAGIQTRGADNNKDAVNKWNLEDHNTTFNVWAWKYYSGAWVSPAVYTQGTVTFENDKWVANPIKFWDKSAEKYYFYAAAPADEKWTLTGTGDAGKLSYANFTLAGGLNNNLSKGTDAAETTLQNSFKNVADVDLMIAEDNVVLRAKYNKPVPDDVNELFDHILSRLNVTVALKADGTIAGLNSDQVNTNDVTVKITSFGITGVNLKNKGTFNEAADLGTDVLNEGTIKRWSSLAVNGTYDLPGANISTTALTTDPLYIAQYLIIPQAITSEVLDKANGKKDTDNDNVGDQNAAHPYFQINYTINDEPYSAYYNLANAFGVAADGTLNFCEGWQNTLNIKIDADIITFDAQVWEWKDKTTHDITIED